ncbi:MAG TPA: ACR3 family arsenite efflux transporter [Thermomicrobiales bacterium]|nr:ACR3 family arsenite efflux transporter [Thermomicrobiales bacterium]
MTVARSIDRPAARPAAGLGAVVGGLSPLDRFLPLWILLAMALGVGLGAAAPGLRAGLNAMQVGTTSLPIALGLLLMLYPVLARVRYEALAKLRRARRLFGVSLLLNWLVGPLVMFALAWLFLPDLPQYRTGLILVGLARCIAMVLVWNQLAGGDREVAAVLVALNSVFQVVAYAFYAYFFLGVLPGWLGLGAGQAVRLSFGEIAQSVAVFLGVPLAAGALTRLSGVRAKGRAWYDDVAMPRLAPLALLALLFTIVVLFALQGDAIVARPGDVLRIALPLVAYFALMFSGAFWLARRAGFAYRETASVAFTAAGNNFELAIAVAVGAFGLASGEALATVVGPLIEVPALVALVYAALWLGRRLPFGDARPGARAGARA